MASTVSIPVSWVKRITGRRKARPYLPVLLAHVAVVLIMCVVAKYTPRVQSPIREIPGPQRHLLSSERLNCTPRSIDEFPPGFMTLEQRKQGGVIIHVLVAIYIFAALAIICDEYFVAALERICEVTKLKPDVAGATFMAAGSSAPELFTSIVGVFFAKSDVGVSTIVGSAVFNILFIVALIGLLTGSVIYLTWWPMFRDSVYYCFSVVALIVVIYDGEVHWYEGFILLVMYVLYIVFMYFNERLEGYMTQILPNVGGRLSEHTPLVESQVSITGYDKVSAGSGAEIEETEAVKPDSSAETDNQPTSPFDIPDTFAKRVFWLIMLPASLVFFVLIPDCRRPGIFKKLYMLTFLNSVLLIAGMSYILVWMVTIIGDTMEVPDTVMGLTLLAAGTSVPDALASVFVARDGFGDMAVSNSVGSNVFDILLCLGLPWLLQTAAVDPGGIIFINSEGLVYSAITLLSTVVLLVVAVAANKWRINKILGVVFLIIYFVVIVFSCMYELNVFGGITTQPCPRQNA